MIHLRLRTILVVFAGLMLLVPSAAFATIYAEEIPIETDAARSFDPLVSDGRVAYGVAYQGGWTMWVVDVGTRETVYHTGFSDMAGLTDFDGPWIAATSGIVNQTTMAYNCVTGESFVIGPDVTFPDVKVAQISGDTIVWTWRRGPDDHPLMITSIAGSTTTSLGSTPGFVTEADGNLALYSAPGPSGDADLFGVDLETGAISAVVSAPGDQTQPALDGDLLAWRDTRNDLNGDIYVMNLKTGAETPVTSDSAAQGSPAVSGDIVVWGDARGDDPDIFVHSMATGATGSVRAPGIQSSPSVDGDVVVYSDSRDAATARDTYAATLTFTGPQIVRPNGPAQLKSGRSGAFRFHLANPDTADSHTIKWDWGDGAHATQSADSSGIVRASHAFDASGTYTVTATVTDESGASGTTRYTVVVR